ncbi:hypothetical protein [Tetragenococcus halophilus]|uniref:Uncharacterized protein n=1 Tax=Tetragenococcus halophilus TaxID=51669 RepID=A0AB37D493_TETHA|nr:hypothetical protein [Tetragenococcus halophilus]MCO8292535.1 hypothetical protein [Tetragenococcus halophilus]MDN6736215.1 hypothetical protein [Tetragenococcus koreensis]QGP76214.1 hypothetical protein GLW17_04915 [Tetragenococcus halophilus]
MKKSSFLRSQYDWWIRYSEAHGINDLELIIHQNDKAVFLVKQNVEK